MALVYWSNWDSLRIFFNVIISFYLQDIATLQLNLICASLHLFDGVMFYFVFSATFYFGIKWYGRANLIAVDEDMNTNSSSIHVSHDIEM
jgi:hypothetical protein